MQMQTYRDKGIVDLRPATNVAAPTVPTATRRKGVGYINYGMLNSDSDDEDMNYAQRAGPRVQTVQEEFNKWVLGTLATLDTNLLLFWEVSTLS